MFLPLKMKLSTNLIDVDISFRNKMFLSKVTFAR